MSAVKNLGFFRVTNPSGVGEKFLVIGQYKIVESDIMYFVDLNEQDLGEYYNDCCLMITKDQQVFWHILSQEEEKPENFILIGEIKKAATEVYWFEFDFVFLIKANFESKQLSFTLDNSNFHTSTRQLVKTLFSQYRDIFNNDFMKTLL